MGTTIETRGDVQTRPAPKNDSKERTDENQTESKNRKGNAMLRSRIQISFYGRGFMREAVLGRRSNDQQDRMQRSFWRLH
jgi:hypothetical protein